MKQIGLLALTIFICLIQVQAQSGKVKEEMVFDKTANGITAHDFGSIIFGANGKVEFTFTNKGTKPLIISKVSSSCGCASPSYSKEPIAPGQKGVITIVYDTKIPGPFNKTVEVTSNANNSPVRISILGKVNAQVSDLKPGQKIESPSAGKTITVQAQSENVIPQDSASRAAAAAVSNANKAAQQEAFKKLVQQPSPAKKTGTPPKGTEVQQTKVIPIKK